MMWMKSYPQLARFWWSRIFRANGMGIILLALQWVATSFPTPALALAYTNTLGRILQILSGYLVSWLSDRVAPMQLIVLGNLLSALFTVAIGLALRDSHQMLTLILAVILWNSFAVVARAASPRIVPTLAAKKDLPAINAWMAAINPIQQFLASGLGGILIAAGVFHAFLAGALAFLIAGIWISPGRQWPRSVPSSIKPAPSLGEGFRFVGRDPVLRRMTLFSSALNLGLSFYIGEYLLYLRSVLGLSPGLIGLSLGLGTIGTLAALLISPWALRNKMIETILVASALVAFGIGIASIAHNWPTFTVGAILIEAGSATITQSLILVRQHVVPLRVMGSVSGALRVLHLVLVPLGMAIAGLVAITSTVHTDLWTSCAMVSLAVGLAVPYARSAHSFIHAAKVPM